MRELTALSQTPQLYLRGLQLRKEREEGKKEWWLGGKGEVGDGRSDGGKGGEEEGVRNGIEKKGEKRREEGRGKEGQEEGSGK